jgi:hypothetical protein
MEIVSIAVWEGSHNMGDNHFDHLAKVRIDGVTHTIWVAVSHMFTMTRSEVVASDGGLTFYRERLEGLDASVLSGELTGGPYMYKPGRKQGPVSDGEQRYDEYPRIVFTAA